MMGIDYVPWVKTGNHVGVTLKSEKQNLAFRLDLKHFSKTNNLLKTLHTNPEAVFSSARTLVYVLRKFRQLFKMKL